MNSYILLCLVALVAAIQTMPTIEDDSINYDNNTSNYDENKNFLIDSILQAEQRHEAKAMRHLHNIVDGKIYHIKAAGVTYRQRLRDDQCVVEYDGKYLTENSVLQLRKKLYRVENCLLERVFHACGPNLLLMLNVVCRVVEQHQTTTPMTLIGRQTMTPPRSFIHRISPRANKTPRVITESCCENLCTISELTRYCHR
ncbi:unnamed protein product [Adineta steineri]|uniref:Insulin-like domain-containing protein n=1 Tax=Adineta steineri TaxID=433720 RepID=A0A813MTW2_9BILA|nr:unnamed protein product [Adineta steineri]CAF0782277.1 unnamed protein product [Adineta steineri]CAF0793603.1 unnamed protein product [Adineta steineri]CAF0797819.1 unnamed protein product [Adineta steineri]CAF0853654.1 unnamed protein product [Adineta steineri]